VSELALDDDQQHAFSGHLDGVRAAELVCVHPNSAAASALAASNQERTAVRVEVTLGERECFLDAKPRSPQNRDQSVGAPDVPSLARGPHLSTRSSTLDGRGDRYCPLSDRKVSRGSAYASRNATLMRTARSRSRQMNSTQQ
jgi:hypothetical protein